MNTFKKTNPYVSAVLAVGLALAISLTGAFAASAQTVPETTMPALYNSAGQEVNNGNVAPLTAGYYFLAPGNQPDTEVYYYGNGTFVNDTTGLYGGSVSNPDGTAGMTLIYGTSASAVPGAPNTGAGGDALGAWMTLAVTGLIAVTGTAYLVTRKNAALT